MSPRTAQHSIASRCIHRMRCYCRVASVASIACDIMVSSRVPATEEVALRRRRKVHERLELFRRASRCIHRIHRMRCYIVAFHPSHPSHAMLLSRSIHRIHRMRCYIVAFHPSHPSHAMLLSRSIHRIHRMRCYCRVPSIAFIACDAIVAFHPSHSSHAMLLPQYNSPTSHSYLLLCNYNVRTNYP